MHNVIGIKLSFSNNTYYFSPNAVDVKLGDEVIVDTEQGLQFGTVVTEIKKEKKENLVLPLKNVIRIATQKDKKQEQENLESAAKALLDAKKIAKDLELDMNFISSNYTFDKKQLFLMYLADDRTG